MIYKNRPFMVSVVESIRPHRFDYTAFRSLRAALLLLSCLQVYAHVQWEIVIPSYNNERWCIKNLESVVMQTYPDWHATVIVDCSTDRTAAVLQAYINEHNLQERVQLVINTHRQGALANIYMAVQACPDDTVIGMLDGDDWFGHDHVLEDRAAVYEQHDIWLTFGSFRFWPEERNGWCRPYSQKIIESNSFRKVENFLPSHFKTFYAWLFKRIKLEDLQHDGKFYPTNSDLAMMFPMIEMAGKRHAWIGDIGYIYNIDNPMNDFKINFNDQMALARFIRNKKPYAPLKER